MAEENERKGGFRLSMGLVSQWPRAGETKPWSPTLRLSKAPILQTDGVDYPGSPLPVAKLG